MNLCILKKSKSFSQVLRQSCFPSCNFISNPALSWKSSTISLEVCLSKILILELLRIVFLPGGISFEIFIIYHFHSDALLLTTDENCFLVLTATYRQNQQRCFYSFLKVEFHLRFEL